MVSRKKSVFYWRGNEQYFILWDHFIRVHSKEEALNNKNLENFIYLDSVQQFKKY
jgi:hypothetical protein